MHDTYEFLQKLMKYLLTSLIFRLRHEACHFFIAIEKNVIH